MSKFLKFAARITCTEYARLQISGPYSKVKVQALTLAIFIPSIMWSLFGFLLSYGVLNHTLLPSLFTGILLGGVVFTLERLIVLGNGNIWMTLLRLALGGAIAFLGAQLIDLVIFKTDIENKLPLVKHEQAKQSMEENRRMFNEKHGLADVEKNIAVLDALWQKQQQEAMDEASGLKGTLLKGVAQATRFKQQVANSTLAQKRALQLQYDSVINIRAAEDELAYKTAFDGISDQSILLRIKAMEMLLQNESAMRHIYWGFTLFMFLLEFLVIIFKLTMPKSAYEKEVLAIERIQEQKLERLYGPQSPILQPHHYHPVAAPISKKLTSNLNTLL